MVEITVYIFLAGLAVITGLLYAISNRSLTDKKFYLNENYFNGIVKDSLKNSDQYKHHLKRIRLLMEQLESNTQNYRHLLHLKEKIMEESAINNNQFREVDELRIKIADQEDLIRKQNQVIQKYKNARKWKGGN